MKSYKRILIKKIELAGHKLRTLDYIYLVIRILVPYRTLGIIGVGNTASYFILNGADSEI